MNIFFAGPSNNQNIAITFDDGPHPVHTLKLLKTLEIRGAKATFFMTGKNASQNKNLVRDVFEQGHEIGNHALNHQRTFFYSPSKLLYEIRTANDILENITGKNIKLYRPPFGSISPFLFSVCKKLSLKIILWNINSHDYRREHCSTIFKRIKKRVKPGSIILFHERHYDDISLDYHNTIETVNYLLDFNGSVKFNFITVSKLLGF